MGAGIAAGIAYGLHWPTPSGGLLAYLLALGVGGTTGIFAGRAPWKEGAWIEATIKGLVGVAASALLYWLACTYAAVPIPWPGEAHGVIWTSLPILFLTAIGAIYGALVELDNDGAEEKSGAKKDAKKEEKSAAKTRAVSPPKARVAEPEDAEVVAATARPPAKKKSG